MRLKYMLYLTLCVGMCAVVLQLDAMKNVRESFVLFIHHHVGSYMNTCPYHMWDNLLATLKLTSSTSNDQGQKPTTENNVIRYSKDHVFTKEELAQYTGVEGSLGLYIGILGRVYDVKSGEQHYGPGKGYSFFAGRDGTKAFMSGDFTDSGLVDEVIGLTLPQMLELANWIDFYETTYIYKGKVLGNFYDEEGSPKAALFEAERLVDDALKDKESKEEHKRKFPPCNSSWTKAKGGWVSCSDKSGGISRDWVGVPRKYHSPGKPTICVCVRTSGPPYDDPDSEVNRGELDNPHVEEYPDCQPTAVSCKSF